MDNTHLPRRKCIRLRNYDYSQTGCYFITICTHKRKNILCSINEAGLFTGPDIELTDIGKVLEKSLINIGAIIPGVYFNSYVIMPDHIYAIIVFDNVGGHGNLPLQDVIGRIKSYTAFEYNNINKTKGLLLWQRSFYEHIIRNEEEFRVISEYMESNPAEPVNGILWHG